MTGAIEGANLEAIQQFYHSRKYFWNRKDL